MFFEFFSQRKGAEGTGEAELSEENIYHQMPDNPVNTTTSRRSRSASTSALEAQVASIEKNMQDANQNLIKLRLKMAMTPIANAMQDGIKSVPSVSNESSLQKREGLRGFSRDFNQQVDDVNSEAAERTLVAYIRLAATPRYGSSFGKTHSFKAFIKGLQQEGSDEAIEKVYDLYYCILMGNASTLVPETEVVSGESLRGQLELLAGRYSQSQDKNEKKQVLAVFEKMIKREQCGCVFLRPAAEKYFTEGISTLDELDLELKTERTTLCTR